MKSIIYYFTGTGNSLAAARKIAASLGDSEVVPIASLQNTPGKIVPDADRIGIVCPVYFSGIPVMVAEFAGRLDPAAATYLFAVVTHGGGGGSAALRQVDGILRQRGGRGLDAGFSVTMPGNYILMYSAPDGKRQEELFSRAQEEIAVITEALSRCRKQVLPSSVITRVLYALLYPGFAASVHTNDKKFTANEKCTSCGTCAAVCPAENIEMIEGRPVWKHRCELCCGCIQLCPVQAIQAGTSTESRVRYRHPDLKVADMKAQRGEALEK